MEIIGRFEEGVIEQKTKTNKILTVFTIRIFERWEGLVYNCTTNGNVSL